MTGRCWTVLHRPIRAIPVLERALGTYCDTQARDKALYLSWLADAYLDANEIEQACAAGSAVRLASGVGSIRPGQRLDAFLHRLEPHAEMPCVVELQASRVYASSTERLNHVRYSVEPCTIGTALSCGFVQGC